MPYGRLLRASGPRAPESSRAGLPVEWRQLGYGPDGPILMALCQMAVTTVVGYWRATGSPALEAGWKR